MKHAKKKQKMPVKNNKWTSGVNIEKLLEIGKSIDGCVESVLAAPSIESLIEQSHKGDRVAAKRLLATASAYLKFDVFGPMPSELRRYLGMALAKVSLGESADVVFNLKREGRPRQEHFTKLRIAKRIHSLRNQGNSLEKACFDVADEIREKIKKFGMFYGYTTPPSSEMLGRIYCEVLPDLLSIYAEVAAKT